MSTAAPIGEGNETESGIEMESTRFSIEGGSVNQVMSPEAGSRISITSSIITDIGSNKVELPPSNGAATPSETGRFEILDSEATSELSPPFGVVDSETILGDQDAVSPGDVFETEDGQSVDKEYRAAVLGGVLAANDANIQADQGGAVGEVVEQYAGKNMRDSATAKKDVDNLHVMDKDAQKNEDLSLRTTWDQSMGSAGLEFIEAHDRGQEDVQKYIVASRLNEIVEQVGRSSTSPEEDVETNFDTESHAPPSGERIMRKQGNQSPKLDSSSSSPNEHQIELKSCGGIDGTPIMTTLEDKNKISQSAAASIFPVNGRNIEAASKAAEVTPNKSLTAAGSPQNKDVLMAELKAMKIASLLLPFLHYYSVLTYSIENEDIVAPVAFADYEPSAGVSASTKYSFAIGNCRQAG